MSQKPQAHPPVQKRANDEPREIQTSGVTPTFTENVAMTVKLFAVLALILGLILLLDQYVH